MVVRQDSLEPQTLAPKPPDEPHLIFRRGKSYPRANAWFGFTSFWGHLFHLAASVIATEDIDARDWMQPRTTAELTDAVLRQLGGSGAQGALTERLDEDLWIDFIADTGDDADVSSAVADMLFRAYVSPSDGAPSALLPRGTILLFGGDTAYPVATDAEIHNRVCVPFNRVLMERGDGVPRVLLGIPGNHDWYDGLDGFARMFRARRGRLTRVSAPSADASIDTTVDKTGQVGHFAEWVEAFRVGNHVAKRATLPLIGYEPVQTASYFALALAPELDLWGVDRQLRVVDYAQRSFFMQERGDHPGRGRVLTIADPAYRMLEPYVHGQRTLEAVDVDFEREGALVLAGDTHHYCRQQFGQAIHITAGGGGAFLHPARISRRGTTAPQSEFPGPRASTALVLQVPWQLAYGRAGFIVHITVALLYLPIYLLHFMEMGIGAMHVAIGVIITVACALLAGWRESRRLLIGTLATLCGAWITALPHLALMTVDWLSHGGFDPLWVSVASLLVATPLAVLGFGTLLMVLTVLGVEHNQAYSTLAHPGYKHFTRMRVHKDGSRIDAWVIGKVDTLDPDAEIVLVDRWTWNNPANGDSGRADRKEA